MLTGNCPCGFSFKTPAGKEDAIETLQDHVARNHKDLYPQGLSRDEAIEEIKEVE
jgi:hypothetical protein